MAPGRANGLTRPARRCYDTTVHQLDTSDPVMRNRCGPDPEYPEYPPRGGPDGVPGSA